MYTQTVVPIQNYRAISEVFQQHLLLPILQGIVHTGHPFITMTNFPIKTHTHTHLHIFMSFPVSMLYI